MTIVPFEFESHEVRTVVIDGEPWFVARDVACALGYVNVADAISKHCKGVANRYPLPTAGGTQQVRIISEPDVLRLIVSSKLPTAEAFERLVFEDILPTIRKTGGYGMQKALTEDEIVAQALQITVAKVQRLEAKVAEDAPKVEYMDKHVIAEADAMTFRDAAKHLGIREKDLRQGLVDAKWVFRLPIERKWTATGIEEIGEWRPYAEHAGKFRLKAQHNAPRHHNGQVRQTLYILAAALPRIAKRLGVDTLGVA